MLDVTCAIIINNREILVTQNGKDSDHPFEWEFPGGKTEPGESPDRCIVREIKEELNVYVEIIESLKPVVYAYSNKTIQLIPFVCRITKGDIHLKEHIAYKWIKHKELNMVHFSAADKKLINETTNYSCLKECTGEQMDNTR